MCPANPSLYEMFVRGLSQQSSKHKVFLSYYHKDDEGYRKRFEKLFGHLFINTSVGYGDIDSDNSTEYIKQLVQKNYITQASVVVVLVGPKTFCRKHVDWEISACLNKKVGGYSGLIGLCLPNHSAFRKENYSAENVPYRLCDNLKSGYATFSDWIEDENIMIKRIEKAFNDRIEKKEQIDNSRLQFSRNLCE